MFCLMVIGNVIVGCGLAGPRSVSNGRQAYNAVINATEDQQLLSYIVRERYDETAGLLAVSSVTASMRMNASIGAEFGIGPSRNFDGNLVPLSTGLGYEESPTITYTPVRGEHFLHQMLAPIPLEQALLLSRADAGGIQPLRLLIRRINGIGNPMFVETGTDTRFDRFLALYTALRDDGLLDVIRTDDEKYFLLLQQDPRSDAACEVISLLGLEDSSASENGPYVVPLQSATGAPKPKSIDIETTSVFEVIQLAASGVVVPNQHVEAGVARRSDKDAGRSIHTITIGSSREQPRDTLVAVRHRGWWFSIDSTDARSKRFYILLRTLIGIRLDDPGPAQAAPLLTVPVGR